MSQINTTFVVVAVEKIIRKKYNFNLLMLFQATNIFLQAKLSVLMSVLYTNSQLGGETLHADSTHLWLRELDSARLLDRVTTDITSEVARGYC